MFNFKQMFVLFWFWKSDAVTEKLKRKENPDYDTLGGVCCRVTIDTQVVEIGSVHINIRRSMWDEKAQQASRSEALLVISQPAYWFDPIKAEKREG